MIVTTPEKWDVITHESSDMALSMLVKLLIIDEVYLLNDDRGPVIEALVAHTLRQVESTQSMICIVGLSATLPNYLEVVDSLRRGHQVMVFVYSRKDTGKTANKLVEMTKLHDGFDLFTNASHPQQGFIKKEVMKSRNRELVQLFEYDVGVHHAGVLRSDRGLTERLFSEGLLRVLVCRATLAWGVNLPAHTVVIKVIPL